MRDQFPSMNKIKAAFVCQYFRSRFIPNPCQPCVVARWNRLLDDRQLTVCQFTDAANGRRHIPTAVSIDRQCDIRADRLTDDADAFDIANRIGADLHLDRREARSHQLGRATTSPLRFVGSQRKAAANTQSSTSTAQQFIDRLAEGST